VAIVIRQADDDGSTARHRQLNPIEGLAKKRARPDQRSELLRPGLAVQPFNQWPKTQARSPGKHDSPQVTRRFVYERMPHRAVPGAATVFWTTNLDEAPLESR